MIHPAIGEEGREFLVGLMSQLSREQVRQMFTAARTELSPNHPVSADQWVHWFWQKFNRIKDHAPCRDR